MGDSDSSLRDLPSVDRVLRSANADALGRYPRELVVESVRAILEALREGMRELADARVPSEARILAAAMGRIQAMTRPSIRRVVNATGVVLHTNLGRALLAPEAVEAVTLAAEHPINLEIDLTSGARGERDSLILNDLLALTGAEAGTVVNNNAAAVLLALNSLAQGKEVIVSRGELIEIGGAFRIPEIMAKSGAILREVGTTNRTHPRDYLDAINDRTGLLLKVHTSNYRVVGFTSEVALEEICAIGRERGLPVMEDLGSGALLDLSSFGLPREPIVAERIRAGADVVTFSGDKLLGGPQAGFIVGTTRAIEATNRNPLKRALRCDKLTLAAAAATLRLYRTSTNLAEALPTLRWLTHPIEEMERIGEEAVALLRATLGGRYQIEVLDSDAEIGSGAQPTQKLASKAIVISHPGIRPHDIANRFRRGEPPILGRVWRDRFWLDLRGIFAASDLVPKSTARPSR